MVTSTGSNIFGGITFVLIVVLALAAIAVMIYGRYLKQRRLAGEKELIERREAAHVDAVVVEPEAPIAEDVSAPAKPVEDVAAAAPLAPKTNAKAAPKAEAAVSRKAEAAPKAKAAPKAATVAPTVSPKVEAAPKAKAAPKPKATPKTDVATPTAPPKAEPAPKTKAAPKAEAAAPAASPPPEAAPAPASASDGDITQLKGLGPKLATTLAEMGYTRLDQIAGLTPDQAAELDAKLGAFQGRIARDRWIEQATLLVAGDRAAYEAAFGKLG